ncbi:MAG TPA: low molecular weight protein arginine phosphatase [Candidatus Lokiarchaeia archaeon]|nr:low molecular weight protein arginine phosphatase [Candidatus Lokiarchaeia archaeon]
MPIIDLKNVKSLLFVCLGNTCRSPAAEGFAKKFAREIFPPDDFAQLRIESAGLSHSFLGAQPQSIKFLKETEGEDISGHVSRAITEEMARQFDVIITMERYMKPVIATQFSNVEDLEDRIVTLKEICQDEMQPANLDIPDPYLMPDYVYYPILEEIRIYMKCFIIKWFSTRHGSQSE